MIKEITVSPKPQNKKARMLFFILMAVFLLLIVTYLLVDKYKGVIGLVAIGFLTIGLLIYTKYIAPKFYYDITFDCDNTPIFVVRRIVGKRQETLARLDLADIVKVERETRDERKKHKTPAGVLKYNYCPTLDPDSSARLTVRSRYERAEINIEVSNEFLAYLFECTNEARTMRAAEDGY